MNGAKGKMTFEELLARANATKKTRRTAHEEEELQLNCCRWFDRQWGHRRLNGVEIRRLLHHSPNGGKAPAREPARCKPMGTRPGFPDLWLGVPVNGCPYLCIELKTLKKGSRQSDLQRDYERLVTAMGARYVVVRTLQEFIDTVNGYLAPLHI